MCKLCKDNSPSHVSNRGIALVFQTAVFDYIGEYPCKAAHIMWNSSCLKDIDDYIIERLLKSYTKGVYTGRKVSQVKRYLKDKDKVCERNRKYITQNIVIQKVDTSIKKNTNTKTGTITYTAKGKHMYKNFTCLDQARLYRDTI